MDVLNLAVGGRKGPSQGGELLLQIQLRAYPPPVTPAQERAGQADPVADRVVGQVPTPAPGPIEHVTLSEQHRSTAGKQIGELSGLIDPGPITGVSGAERLDDGRRRLWRRPEP